MLIVSAIESMHFVADLFFSLVPFLVILFSEQLGHRIIC